MSGGEAGGPGARRSVPSFIEARPPLVTNPWMRPRPQHATNLLHLYEDESLEEPALAPESDADLVQVYLRIKPNNESNTLYDIRSDKHLATSSDLQPSDYNRKTQCNLSKIYTFSHIFRADTSQKEVFDHVVKDNLKKLPEGNSYTLLMYGASGSGKTYTLMGTVAQPGLVPRSLEYLFKIINPAQHPQYRPRDGAHETLIPAQQAQELQLVSRLRQSTAPARGARRAYKRMSVGLSGDFHSVTSLVTKNTHFVWVSFIEIYNEAVYDLLQPMDRTKAAAKLKICEDPRGVVYVKGATQAFVRTGTEAHDVMVAGKMNLRVAATGVHAQSSRSHCIFTITLLSATPDGVMSSCVRLCDLAGSERAERTRNAGVRMAESRAINSSLHVLERCLHLLKRKQRAGSTTDAAGANLHVPFRESKLTRLLGAPLSGASREAVSMVVTVNPSPLYTQETRHVLQYAAIASDIYVNPTTAVDMTYAGTETTVDSEDNRERDFEIMSLRAEIERLQNENERLHLSLERASRCAESSRQEAATTMEELVEEAKDMTRVYFNQKIALLEQKHRMEMEMREKQLSNLAVEVTLLKEQLSGQPLKHALVESEIEHLYACLAERDQAATEALNSEKSISPPQSVIVLDSDNESDSDSDYDNLPLDSIPEEIFNRSLAKLLRSSDGDKAGSCDQRLTGTISAGTQYSDSETEEHSDDEHDETPTHSSNVNIIESIEKNRLEKCKDINSSSENDFTNTNFISNNYDETRNSNLVKVNDDLKNGRNINDLNNLPITSKDGNNIDNEGNCNSAVRVSIAENDIRLDCESSKDKNIFGSDNMKDSGTENELKRCSIACKVSSTNSSDLVDCLNQESQNENYVINTKITENVSEKYKRDTTTNEFADFATTLPDDNMETISNDILPVENSKKKSVKTESVKRLSATEIILKYSDEKGESMQNEITNSKIATNCLITTEVKVKSRDCNNKENVSPHLMAQSCPAKSAGRRKLFTPRAEPLDDEVPSDSEGASMDRIRIPRPSYHRNTRARRKL